MNFCRIQANFLLEEQKDIMRVEEKVEEFELLAYSMAMPMAELGCAGEWMFLLLQQWYDVLDSTTRAGASCD